MNNFLTLADCQNNCFGTRMYYYNIKQVCLILVSKSYNGYNLCYKSVSYFNYRNELIGIRY